MSSNGVPHCPSPRCCRWTAQVWRGRAGAGAGAPGALPLLCVCCGGRRGAQGDRKPYLLSPAAPGGPVSADAEAHPALLSAGVSVVNHRGPAAASSLRLGCCQCAAGARWWCRRALGTRPSDHPPTDHPCAGPLFWVPLLEEEENPHRGNASFPTPTRCKHPPTGSAAPRLTVVHPTQEVIDVTDVLWDV